MNDTLPVLFAKVLKTTPLTTFSTDIRVPHLRVRLIFDADVMLQVSGSPSMANSAFFGGDRSSVCQESAGVSLISAELENVKNLNTS